MSWSKLVLPASGMVETSSTSQWLTCKTVCTLTFRGILIITTLCPIRRTNLQVSSQKRMAIPSRIVKKFLNPQVGRDCWLSASIFCSKISKYLVVSKIKISFSYPSDEIGISYFSFSYFKYLLKTLV